MISVGLDTETTGVDIHHECRPFLTGLSYEDGSQLIWPWKVDPLTRKVTVPREDLLEITQHLDEADEIIIQNAKFDVSALVSVGLKWKRRWWDKVHDTTYSGHLLESNGQHNLTDMVVKYLRYDIQPLEDKLGVIIKECQGIAKKEFPEWRIAKHGDPGLPSLKKGSKKAWKWDLWLAVAVAEAKDLSPKHPYWTATQEYLEGDIGTLIPLWREHRRLIEKRGLWKVYQQRQKLPRIITGMERNGVTYSEDRLQEKLPEFRVESVECEKVCFNVSDGKCGELPKSGTTKEMRKVLFEDFKLPVIEKSDKTGEPSVDKEVLGHWMATVPERSKAFTFIKNLGRKRQVDTAISYMESYDRFGVQQAFKSMVRGSWRRLHPSLNGTGTDTLRMTSSNPNEQNISKQGYANLRYLFGPLPGREWWSLDYSNLELRLPAYEAQEKEMIWLFEHPDAPPYFGSVHLLIFETLHPEMFKEYGAKVKDVFKDTWYQWTKNGDFAVQYGAVAESGTADRAYHVPGAQVRIQERFYATAELNTKWVKYAEKHGQVWTMEDRECGSYPLRVARGERGNIKPTVPLNYRVQGTAMWSMCRAMVRVQEYLDDIQAPGFDPYINLQVHDEMDFDFPTGTSPQSNLEHVMNIKRIMERSGEDIGVPLRVDVNYHPNNWSKSEPFDVTAA